MAADGQITIELLFCMFTVNRMETSYQQQAYPGGPPPLVVSSPHLPAQPMQAHPSHVSGGEFTVMQPTPFSQIAQFVGHPVNTVLGNIPPYIQPSPSYPSHAAHGGSIPSSHVQLPPAPPPPYLNTPVEQHLDQENEQLRQENARLKRDMVFFQYVHNSLAMCCNSLSGFHGKESSSTTVNVVLPDKASPSSFSVTCWRAGLNGNQMLLNKERELEQLKQEAVKHQELFKSLNDGATAVVNNPEPAVSTITFPRSSGDPEHPLHKVDAILYPTGEYQKQQKVFQEQTQSVMAACRQAGLDYTNHPELANTISGLRSKIQEETEKAKKTSKEHEECKTELTKAQEKIHELETKLSTYKTETRTGPEKISTPESNSSSPVGSPDQPSSEDESEYDPQFSGSSTEESLPTSAPATSVKRKKSAVESQSPKLKRRKRKPSGMAYDAYGYQARLRREEKLKKK